MEIEHPNWKSKYKLKLKGEIANRKLKFKNWRLEIEIEN